MLQDDFTCTDGEYARDMVTYVFEDGRVDRFKSISRFSTCISIAVLRGRILSVHTSHREFDLEFNDQIHLGWFANE